MDNSVVILPELRSAVERELAADERITWLGQPNPRYLLGMCIALSGIGVLMAAWGVYIGITIPDSLNEFAETNKIRAMFLVVAGIMIVFGLGIAVLAPLALIRIVRKTVYALTNQRALVLQAKPFNRTVHSFGPAALANVTRRDRRDDSGDLIFAQEQRRDSEGHRYYAPVGFQSIPNVRTVENMVRELAQSGK